MSIQSLLLGSLVSKGADRLLNPAKYRENQFRMLTGDGFSGQGDEEKDKGPTTFGGIAKQGIMSVIARALLGPIFGPLALTVGQNFLDRRQQRLGLIDKGGDPSQIGPQRGGVTATAPQFADVQDTLGSMDSGTDIDYDTGDITDAATGTNIGNVYDEVALTGGDDSGGSTGSMDASDFSDDTAGTPFKYGGLASLYR